MDISAPSYNITYRTYKDGDEHSIIKLRKEVTGKDMSLDEWTWKFTGQGNKKVHVFVMEEDTHGIIGHWGGIPLRMVHDGKKIKGVSGCNVMIHPRFRGFVGFKKLHSLFVEALINDSVTFIYGFPTEKTFMLPAEKLGIWERVEDIYESIRDVRFHNDSVRFLYKLFPLTFESRAIDILWDDVGNHYKLSIIKDTLYLSWRYKRNPLFKYQIWGLRKRWSKALMAFAIIKVDGSADLRIMDMVFRKGMFPILLSKIENLAYSMGKERLCLFIPQRYNSFLKERGFSSKPSCAVIARANHPRTLKKDEIVEKFFYTMGDTDFL